MKQAFECFAKASELCRKPEAKKWDSEFWGPFADFSRARVSGQICMRWASAFRHVGSQVAHADKIFQLCDTAEAEGKLCNDFSGTIMLIRSLVRLRAFIACMLV